MSLKLGVTLYSFNVDYYTYRYSLQDCFAAAGSLGEGQGVEIVAPQMIRRFPELTPEFEYTFRKLVDQYGLQPSAYGAYADRQRFRGRLANRDEQIDYLRLQIRAAARLGFPVIRTQVAESVINDLLPYAEKYDVRMGMEIHAPMTVDALAPAIEMVQKIDSPYLGFTPDSGAFCHSPAAIYVQRFTEQGVPREVIDHVLAAWRERTPVEQVRHEVATLGGGALGDLMAVESEVYFGHGDPSDLVPLLPHIVHVHGKFYGIDESGTDSAVRFPEIVSVLLDGDYDGFLSCEYEGHHWDTELSALDQLRTVQGFLRREIDAEAAA
ncbi:sugar phosphate isomerase/epimerase family protein [Leifsonia sp. 2MCAF36]|uniref:sugar phosphate isomerase/epimerase family protein n=1 Tax=Leifsonia sp. 2MCAF36 TaxID=3232988 RepID=UPI003F94C6C5